MITENMKKIKMQNRNELIFMFAFLVSSCLKETAVPIESAFTIETSEDKTSPVTIQLKNESYGADEYEWTFEGGQPGSFTDKSPGKVVFTQAGEHKITLRVWNAVEEKTSQQTLRVDSAMTIDFDFTVAINVLRELSPSSTKAKVEANTSGHLKVAFPLHPTDSILAR